MTRADRKAQKLQAQCDEFNAATPIGSEVLVKRDNGENVLTRTSTEAQVLSGHTAVIWLEGISGCYLLDRVSKVLVAFERKDGKLAPRKLAQDGGAS
jgi:hypothetical protein